MEYSISASDVRKSPGQFFDRVIREHPVAITRRNDLIMALSKDQFQALVDHIKLTIDVEYEDGVYSVYIPELDLLAWGEDLEEAKDELVDDVIEYAKDYMNRFNLFFNAPNRKHHLPYILRILLFDDKDQVKGLFTIA